MRPYEALWFRFCHSHSSRSTHKHLPLNDLAYWAMRIPLHTLAAVLIVIRSRQGTHRVKKE